MTRLARCANHDLEECPTCGTYGVMSTPKQVIVMRKDLNMRKGKMIAQGAHASLGAVLMISEDISHLPWRLPFKTWLEGTFTKICVSVDSEEALLAVRDSALAAGLPVKLIQDAGHTEFKGVPTYTCLAIGPCWSEDVDPITKELPLL